MEYGYFFIYNFFPFMYLMHCCRRWVRGDKKKLEALTKKKAGLREILVQIGCLMKNAFSLMRNIYNIII